MDEQLSKLTPQERETFIKILTDRSLLFAITRHLVCKIRAMEVPAKLLEREKFEPPPEPKVDPAIKIYKAYPRKVGEPAALKAIRRAIKAGNKVGYLLDQTNAYAKIKSEELSEDPKLIDFIPHPSTWFNQDRFKDDPSTWRRVRHPKTNFQSMARESAQLARIEDEMRLMNDPPADLIARRDALKAAIQADENSKPT